MKTELLSRLFLEKAESFGISRTSSFKESEQNFRKFLNYIHEIGGWVVSSIATENETKQSIHKHILVIFTYQLPQFPPDVKAKMILAIPEDFALKVTVLGYLP